MDKITRVIVWLIFIIILTNTQFISWKLNLLRDHLCAVSPHATDLCPLP